MVPYLVFIALKIYEEADKEVLWQVLETYGIGNKVGTVINRLVDLTTWLHILSRSVACVVVWQLCVHLHIPKVS